jgi:hypothetical protein
MPLAFGPGGTGGQLRLGLIALELAERINWVVRSDVVERPLLNSPMVVAPDVPAARRRAGSGAMAGEVD